MLHLPSVRRVRTKYTDLPSCENDGIESSTSLPGAVSWVALSPVWIQMLPSFAYTSVPATSMPGSGVGTIDDVRRRRGPGGDLVAGLRPAAVAAAAA